MPQKFYDAFELYCAGLSQEERDKLTANLDKQSKNATDKQAQQLDQLKQCLLAIWTECPPNS